MLRALLFMLGVLSCVGVCGAARAQKARVSMEASATQVQVGDPFMIEIRADVSGDDVDDIAIPDFGKLEILGRRMSRPFSFSFGFGSGGQHAQVQSQVVHDFTVRATEPGTYVIQPAIITVGNRKYASQKLTITVSGAALPQPPAMNPGQPRDDSDQAESVSAAPPDGPLSGARFDNDLFLRTVVDKSEASVGEQVTVTVYLYVRGGLSQNPSITREPTAEGFWVQDLLPVQRSLAPVRQSINGRNFNVFVLRRFAAFPLRAGKLQIGAPAIEISSGDSLFDLLTGPRETVRRNGVAVPVEARALPAVGADDLVHVGTLSLEASLDPPAAKVGDAVTLRVVAKGQGNLKALKLKSPTLDGVDVLAPEIDDKVSTDLDQVGGERSFRWLLLPRRPGKLELAPFRVRVFDPQTKAWSDASTAALSLEVSAGTAAPEPAAKSKVEPDSNPAETAGVPSPGFGPARTVSALNRDRFQIASQPWFPWAVAAGPLACLTLLLGGAARRRLRERRQLDPRGEAQRTSEAKLAEAEQNARTGRAPEAYAALLAALKAALQARLDEPVGGLTRAALQTLCIERGMHPELAQRLANYTGELEQARFDPTRQAGAQLDKQIAEARTLTQEIARFRAKEAA